MITKAIVEEIVSPYQVKIRVPILDRLQGSPLSTSLDNLNTATICTLPNCYVNIQVGDIVFVGFEDNTYYKAVVLGHLSRKFMSNTYADVHFGNLTVEHSATLPNQTTIGEISSQELSALIGVKENLQSQIDDLKNEIISLRANLGGHS